MQKTAAFFFAIALVVANVGISAASAAGAATLSLSPTNVSVKTGDSFSLSVAVTPNGESLDTARVNLSWDASKLEALAFDLGSLFPNLSPSNSISNSAGTLTYGVYKFGTPVTSSGTLATVTFRALKSGSATVSVASDSKLISDGAEKMSSTLGKATITITGTDAKASAPATSGDSAPAAAAPATSTPSAPAPKAEPASNTEAAALKYFGALSGRLPTSTDDWVAVKCMVNAACKAATQDLVKEKQSLALFTKKYGSLPKTSMEWNVIHAIAYTNVFIKWPAPAAPSKAAEPAAPAKAAEPAAPAKAAPAKAAEPATPAAPAAPAKAAEPAAPATPATPAAPAKAVEPAAPAAPATPAAPAKPEPSLEQQALKYFGAFFGRLPKTDDEWKALKCIANGGCQGSPRDVEKEKAALKTFGAKYGKMPSTSMEWNLLHTIAYTNLLLAGQKAAAPVAAPASPVVAETKEAEKIAPAEKPVEPTKELTLEQQAVGWFGKLAGKLPSTDADWKAVNYMVNGYKPSVQDVEAESEAVALFAGKFGKLPSTTQDWKIIAAIAYSGAF